MRPQSLRSLDDVEEENMKSATWIRSALVFGSLGLLACSKQGASAEPENNYTAANDPTLNEPEPAADPMASAGGTTESTLTPEPVGTIDPSMSKPATGIGAVPTSSTAPLTDGQIAKVAETVDKGEIEQAKEVQKRAKNPQVKQLAAQLIQHHTKSKQKGQTLAKKEQLTLEESPVCEEIGNKAEQNLQAIKSASAPNEAERAYVDAQIAQHEEVLQLLNTRLIPSAVNADLKAQLEETRKMVESHIEQARKVQQALSESATATPSAG